MSRIPWLIVGGGIHGVHIAACLRERAGVSSSELLIVDPGPALLASWLRQVAAVGMRYLRSPAVHHLDVDPFSLLHFAERLSEPGLFRPSYNRPSVALFERHCASVIERYELEASRRQGRAVVLEPGEVEVGVELESGERLRAERVVLAPGLGGSLAWPEALASLCGSPRVAHVFAEGAGLRELPQGQRFAVLGAGISGAQLALRLARAGREVELISRHELREHAFDSDPGWLGPRNMAAFAQEPSLPRRRDLISAARHRGSMPQDVRAALSVALGSGRVRLHRGAVERAVERGDGLLLEGSGLRLEVDRLYLATGFERRPIEPLVERLASRYRLPLAPCGAPLPDEALCWGKRLFLSGGLAELRLGPVARNISGARRAAERILAHQGVAVHSTGRRGGRQRRRTRG